MGLRVINNVIITSDINVNKNSSFWIYVISGGVGERQPLFGWRVILSWPCVSD